MKVKDLFFMLLFLFTSLNLAFPLTASAQTTVGGYPMPSLDDERNTYRAWGWSWTVAKEPKLATDATFSVSNPDVHGNTEGDDLWTYLMMYRRTGLQGYLDRARAWADYFKNRYRTASNGLVKDHDFDYDHLYGWGLVAWYEQTGDAAALAEAENIAAVSETEFSGATPGKVAMGWAMRQRARHLLLATRVAEATKKARWIALRDKFIDLWLRSPDWDPRGMYFSEASTDHALGAGAYAGGARIQSTFQIGVLTEAFAHAYRTTGRTEIRDKMIAMARYVAQYGMDSTYQLTGNTFGIVNGRVWHNYSSGGTATFWDPVYTTSVANTLAYGYKFTGDIALLNRAQVHFNRGTKGVYGSPTIRTAGDKEVHHFVDTVLDSSTENFYLAYNKGELQYTYLLFENGGSPTVQAGPPMAPPQPPTNLTVK